MPAAIQLLVLVIAVLGFWLIVLRPQRRQQQHLAKLRAELAPGDEVITAAGIFGFVRAVGDDGVIDLEVAPGTVLKVARQAVVGHADEVRATPDDESDPQNPSGPDQSGPDQSGPDQSGPDQSGPDQSGPDRSGTDQSAD